MRKISGIVLSLVMLMSIGVAVANAQETTAPTDVYRLMDTPSKYGFKGLYTLFSPDTAQKGQWGLGFYWDMTRFSLPGDPRYPVVHELTAGGYYGITDKLEIGVSAPYRMVRLTGADAASRDAGDIALDDVEESGMSNASVGLRFALIKAENGEGFGLTPYVLAYLPTAQDPDKGTGADNTRIHIGVSAGTVLKDMGKTRLYTQVAYQIATDYDQDRRDFSENGANVNKPRFERFGTNPLFQEYGNTLFYGAGIAVPLSEDRFEIFAEAQMFHSFEDANFIPLYEDGKEMDDVQDGGIGVVGVKAGFGNGLAITAGWGGKIFGKEPTFEAPMNKIFAGLTYNRPAKIVIVPRKDKEIPEKIGQGQLGGFEPRPSDYVYYDCKQALAMVHFEFDKSTLTPESIEVLKAIGKYLRLCPETTLEVQGHTDWVGTENYNMGLGNRRARAVVYYLVFDEGIDPARLVKPEKLQQGIIAGETYGESQPVASNETDAGRAENRRAQFVKLTEDKRVLKAEVKK